MPTKHHCFISFNRDVMELKYSSFSCILDMRLNVQLSIHVCRKLEIRREKVLWDQDLLFQNFNPVKCSNIVFGCISQEFEKEFFEIDVPNFKLVWLLNDFPIDCFKLFCQSILIPLWINFLSLMLMKYWSTIDKNDVKRLITHHLFAAEAF